MEGWIITLEEGRGQLRVWFAHPFHGYDGVGPAARFFLCRVEARAFARENGDFQIRSTVAVRRKPRK